MATKRLLADVGITAKPGELVYYSKGKLWAVKAKRGGTKGAKHKCSTSTPAKKKVAKKATAKRKAAPKKKAVPRKKVAAKKATAKKRTAPKKAATKKKTTAKAKQGKLFK